MSATSTHLLQKRLQVKKEPVDTSTKLWTRFRWWSNFPKLFRIDGKKTWKKPTASVWSIQKWWLLFTSKNSILKKLSLIKKNGDWNIHPHENRQLQLGKPPSRWVGELRCEDRHLPMDHHQRLRFDSGRPGGAKGVNAGNGKPRVFPGGKNLYFRAYPNDVCCCFSFK